MRLPYDPRNRFRALCAELVTELEGWCGTGSYDNTANAHSVIDRARAALARWGRPVAAPVPETGEAGEYEWKDIGDGRVVRVQRCHKCGVCPSSVDDCGCFGDSRCPCFGIDAMAAPPAPLEGEAGELVAELEVAAVTVESEGGVHEAAAVRRAADLLEQRHPEPVPASERLPGPEDMTDDGEVWIEDPGYEYSLADAGDYDWEPHKWILRPIGKFDAQNGLRWLPAHALPVPGEVEG